MLKRTRSRSRSPPLKIPKLLKLRRRVNESSEIEERDRDVYRIIYSVYGMVGVFKSFSLDIPSEILHSFRNGTHNPHPHGSHQLPLKPQLLVETTSFMYGKPVLIGSTIYTMASEELFTRGTEFNLITLDLTPYPNDLQWDKFSFPPPFDLYTSYESILIYLRGCLFVLLASPYFGVFFDFTTNEWSVLEGPHGVNLNPNRIDFVSSLGESAGKIMLHVNEGYDGPNSWIHIYDVTSRRWTTCSGEPLQDGYMGCYNMLDRPAVVDQDGDGFPTIYFMHNSAVIYAFDYKTMKLHQGPVLGFDRFDCGFELTLFLHFGGDLFCVCTSGFDGDADDVVHSSRFHFIFIRVTKMLDSLKDDDQCTSSTSSSSSSSSIDDDEYMEVDSCTDKFQLTKEFRSRCSLNAYVVGCLEYSVAGNYMPHGGLFI